MEKVLTDAQVQQFRSDGLLLIPGLIPESVYGPVRDDLERMIEAAKGGPAPDYTYMYYTAPRTGARSWLYRINELIGTHQLESVKLMLAYPPLLSAVQQVVEREHFASSAAAVVFKLPSSEVPVGWHQDGVTVNRWPVFDTDIYLDESDPDNGGLWGIPGSHLAGYNPELRKEVISSFTAGREAGEVPGAVPVIAICTRTRWCTDRSPAARRGCGAPCTSTGTTTPTSRCAPRTTSGAASTSGRSRRCAMPSRCAQAAFRTRRRFLIGRWPRTPCPDPVPSGSRTSRQAGNENPAETSWAA